MARPDGESSNFSLKDEDTTELFEVLQEWNEYLERHVPHFSQPQSHNQSRQLDKAKHVNNAPQLRGPQ